MLALYIANKNYSSWSLRPWVLMRELGITFEERLMPFGENAQWQSYRRTVSSGKVPSLVDGEVAIWDSLSIVEYLAERHSAVWPSDAGPRSWARSAAAEMHSGFSELRNRCSMSCGIRIRLRECSAALEHDLARLDALWHEGLERFGGPFLAGPEFCAVDAFFAPVAFRIQTYGLALQSMAAAYASRLLSLDSMRDWYASALEERFRDFPHEREILAAGEVTADFRKHPVVSVEPQAAAPS